MPFQPFIYQLLYLVFSILGNYNYFFFAAHLLDVAVGVAALRIILEAITYNGKQLALTVMLLTIVVYLYSVVAFNFFRKFYVSEEDDEVDQKCHDMLTVRILIYFSLLGPLVSTHRFLKNVYLRRKIDQNKFNNFFLFFCLLFWLNLMFQVLNIIYLWNVNKRF